MAYMAVTGREWGTTPWTGTQRSPSGPMTLFRGPKGLARCTLGKERPKPENAAAIDASRAHGPK